MFKKMLVLAFLAILATPSFASVGIRINGTMAGTATDLNLVCGSGVNSTGANITPDGSLYNISCSPNLAESGFANAGYVSLASTSATISPSYTIVFKVLDTDQNPAFTTGTLVNGTPGEILTLIANGYAPNLLGTNAAYTLSFATSTTVQSIKFTKTGDSATLVYLDDINGWFLQSSTNVGLTIVYK